MRALAERVAAELGYRGILDLDFRRCGTTGRYHLLDFNPRPGAQFRLFTDTAGLDVVRALHLDLTDRPLPDGEPRPGRTFVVENYAPLSALRPAPDGRELAWHAPDDRAPGRALWALWGRHATGRLLDRLHHGLRPRRARRLRPAPASYARPRALLRPGAPYGRPGTRRPCGPRGGGPGGASLTGPPAPGPAAGADSAAPRPTVRGRSGGAGAGQRRAAGRLRR